MTTRESLRTVARDNGWAVSTRHDNRDMLDMFQHGDTRVYVTFGTNPVEPITMSRWEGDAEVNHIHYGTRHQVETLEAWLTEVFTLCEPCATALMYADDSGLSEEDAERLDTWARMHGTLTYVGLSHDAMCESCLSVADDVHTFTYA